MGKGREGEGQHGQEVLLGQRHWDPGNSSIHWPVLGAGDTLGALAAV